MKKLIHLFFQLSRGKQIACVVCLIHLLALFILTCHHLVSFTMRPPRPMVVRTISFPEEKPIAIAPKPKATQKLAGPKKPAPSKKPAPPPVKKDKEENLLKDIAKSLETLSSSEPTKKVSPLTIPTKEIAKPRVGREEPNYEELLIAFLQNTLDLPEYGEVKIEIEINDFGQVTNCTVLESKSKANAVFLKEKLVLLAFPIPPKDKNKKFSIAFKNE